MFSNFPDFSADALHPLYKDIRATYQNKSPLSLHYIVFQG